VDHTPRTGRVRATEVGGGEPDHPGVKLRARFLAEHVGRRHAGHVLHRAGEPVNYNDFGYHWRRTVLAAGLGQVVRDTGRKRYEGLRYHDLRHAFASLLIFAGCSVKAVQHALGHASAATTLNRYSHLWPGDEDRIATRSTRT
jgi:integrase